MLRCTRTTLTQWRWRCPSPTAASRCVKAHRCKRPSSPKWLTKSLPRCLSRCQKTPVLVNSPRRTCRTWPKAASLRLKVVVKFLACLMAVSLLVQLSACPAIRLRPSGIACMAQRTRLTVHPRQANSSTFLTLPPRAMFSTRSTLRQQSQPQRLLLLLHLLYSPLHPQLKTKVHCLRWIKNHHQHLRLRPNPLLAYPRSTQNQCLPKTPPKKQPNWVTTKKSVKRWKTMSSVKSKWVKTL